MKRHNNLYQTVCSIENLQLADTIARIGKKDHKEIAEHDLNKDAHIIAIHESLRNKAYKTSGYRTFTVHEPKERHVSCLSYYPHRIVHQAVIQTVFKSVFVPMLTADTYSCIEGRGIHGVFRNLKKALRDRDNTTYCLKLDVKKFYPNIDHDILKTQLRRKLKDRDLLWLLDEIIDSAPGLPIGNATSQYLANFYLTPFDHWVKEKLKLLNYFRYMDDIVVLSGSKKYLHGVLASIREYFKTHLNLCIKENYQIFPVAARGIDVVGYRFYHTHILLRKRIKKNFARRMKKVFNLKSFAAYYGLAKHCNSKHLLKKIIGNDRMEGLKHSRTERQRARRRQNKNRADTECENSGSGLQN